MSTLKAPYQCHCMVPVPLMADSPTTGAPEDTGLCQACDMVYDESLYEKRLRQYLSGYTYDSLHDYLEANDPVYQTI